jgi:hypothetical protein
MNNDLFEQIERTKAALEKCRSLGLPKSEPIGQFFANLVEEANIYPVPNLAVEICLHAYISTKKEQVAKGSKSAQAERIARLAYAANLPKLSNADCVRDFIACVVHGMAVSAIPSSEGTRLLYGAQVAHSALPGGKKRRTKRIKNALNTSSGVAPTHHPSNT